MQRLIIFLFGSVVLSACQSAMQPLPLPALANEMTEPAYTMGYAPEQHNVRLSNYVEQLVVLLQHNIDPQQAGTMAVSSFVDFDETLTTSHALGNQLSENFVTQLRRFGFSVIDTKATNTLQITPQGDFIFSRKARRAIRSHQLTSVLAGTLIYTPQGIEVNTRILDLSNKTVTSAAAVTIPYFVVNHLGQVQ